ncbi:thermonuclease family protein [Lentibacter sp. XHP0401]|uniref:thermonuclease family protein n=1 Tax=Lentibacter sp. XHP0401 TaxID=2984334 RepID=UPI0021E8511B|nr:thermonuclease family protein [Lentibacter sp. XHP0401]MCV2894555.1 thermonuclease family protein [Lentibacter sp. XHP0401]
MEFFLLICLCTGVVALLIKEPKKKHRHHSPRQETKAVRRRTFEEGPSQTFDSASSRPAPTQKEVVGRAYVVDGDTIVIQKTQIRLFGIDAPEMNHPFGKKSKWAMVELCKGQVVRAEVTEEDAHGRTVAKCFLPDGRDLSAELVKMGLAIDWPKFSGGIYRDLEVHEARKKMWLADARQKGRMHVWEQFEARQKNRSYNG